MIYFAFLGLLGHRPVIVIAIMSKIIEKTQRVILKVKVRLLICDAHRGIVLAHFLAIAFASPRVDADWRPGTVFHTSANWFEESLGYPGTGGRIFIETSDLKTL